MGADTGPLSGGTDLRALTEGRWSAWDGLTGAPSVTDVEEQLGPSLDPEPHGGMFGGSPALLRRWGPTAGAPRGLTVWFEGDTAVGVQVEGAVHAEDDGPLPDPDRTEDSGLGGSVRQYVWAGRGFVVHAREEAGTAREAALLLGLAPLTLEAWDRDPLRHWGAERRRR